MKKCFNAIADLNIDWCKIIVCESGWVSDNYLEYSKIIKWCYLPLVNIEKDLEMNTLVASLHSTIGRIMCKEVDPVN